MSACAVCGYKSVEAFKFCPECGAAAATQTSEQRRVVTVLFCDVVGSTALGESADPEAVRATLARYFESMRAIVERHGGTVEKFIGDAVMAVFGVPVAHEDDAMRACRAAVEMQDALPALAVEGRIGVATGEVVTGTKERLATGDAVNLAARLQQAARPGEALVGEGTRALGPPPEEEVEVSLKSKVLIGVLSILEDREREVLTLRYGLGDGHPKTLEEIGRGLAVSRERVRQIESAALERMASFREMRDITS